MSISADHLQKFLFTQAPIRGEFLQLQIAWQQILENHPYPIPVQNLLGELVAASALLAATLKFHGALVLQLYGNGPIQMLVAECSADLGIRATAKLHPEQQINQGMNFQELVNQNGQGHFVLTLDPYDRLPGQQPYQGIVPLQGKNLAEVLENYMQQSEQLETRLYLSADAQTTAGLLLQKMPTEENYDLSMPDSDTWNTISQLATTVKSEELLTLNVTTLLQRLFWQQDLLLQTARPCHFFCTCSQTKVGNMLRALGSAEIAEALSTQEVLEIKCEFCNSAYHFDAVDCASLFTELGSTHRAGQIKQ